MSSTTPRTLSTHSLSMGALALGFMAVSAPNLGHAKGAPDKVYGEASALIQDIEALRHHAGLDDNARMPGPQFDKKSAHVYGKALEVAGKIARYQAKLGLEVSDVPTMPTTKPLKHKMMKSLLRQMHKDLDAILEAEGVTPSNTPIPSVEGKTPSEVYAQFWRASYLLDDLVGQANPNMVFAAITAAQADLLYWVDAKGLQCTPEPITRNPEARPAHVAIAAYQNLHLLSWLEFQMGMDPVAVPAYPTGQIYPNNVLDTVSMIRVELARLMVDLDNPQELTAETKAAQKKPADVLIVMEEMTECLQQLTPQK